MAPSSPKGATPAPTDREAAAESRGGALPAGAPGANMDKVRELLFGTQMRELEKRLTRMEDKLAQEQSDFREDARRRFEALEQLICQELATAAERARSEREEREQSVRATEKALLDALRASERKVALLDEQLAKAQRELRQHQHEQSAGLRDELRAAREQLGRSMSRSVDDLRNDKLDRSTLATLLTEVAARLGGEPPGADRR